MNNNGIIEFEKNVNKNVMAFVIYLLIFIVIFNVNNHAFGIQFEFIINIMNLLLMRY